MTVNNVMRVIHFLFVIAIGTCLTAIGFGMGGVVLKMLIYIIYGAKFDAWIVFVFFLKKGFVAGFVICLCVALLSFYKSRSLPSRFK